MAAAKRSTMRWAIGLVLLSGVFWFAMLAVPFVSLPLSAWQKGALAGVLFALVQVSFWLAVLLVGKPVLYRFMGRLLPKRWRRSDAADSAASSPDSALQSGDGDGAPEGQPPGRD